MSLINYIQFLSDSRFLQNKYQSWYLSIIQNALSENREKNSNQYLEAHHILPKSILPEFSNSSWNLVLLTAREHFIVHHLLTKFTQDIDQVKMLQALSAMKTHSEKRKLTAKQYDICKQANSIAMKERWNDNQYREQNSGENHPGFIGYYHTPEGTYQSSTQHPELSHKVILTWCKNHSGFISLATYSSSSYLKCRFSQDELVNQKTFKDIGFWFEPIEQNKIQVYESIKDRLIQQFRIQNPDTGAYNSNCMKESWFLSNGLETELEEILKETEELSNRSFSERVRAFLNLPIRYCPECGKPTKIAGQSSWQRFCSRSCANTHHSVRQVISQKLQKRTRDEKIETQSKRENTFKERYRVSRNAERPEVRQQINRSILEHYHDSKHIQQLEDKSWLEKEYSEKTTSEIAKELGCARSLVLQFLKKHEIPLNYSQLPKATYRLLFNSSDWLFTQIIEQKQSIKMVANKIGVSTTVIRKALNFHQIDTTNPLQKMYTLLAENPDNWLEEQYLNQSLTAQRIADQLGVGKRVVLDYLKKHGIERRHYHQTSQYEKMLVNFIRGDLGIQNIIQSDRSVLDGLEIDIFLPDYQIGIEINGLYWHSLKDRTYHINKTELADSKQIRLYHFTDQQFIESSEIIFSIIRNALNKNENRIYARNCQIRDIESSNEVKPFLDRHHIQGSCSFSKALGLYYNDELISIMTFGKPRFSREYDWELIRFCSQLNTSVAGGFSKLLNYFKSKQNGSIISYADRFRSNGLVYEKAGFELLRKTQPGFVWTNGKTIYPRYKTQKSKLAKLLGEDRFNPNLTEVQNMSLNGFKKFWDCGQLVYVLN